MVHEGGANLLQHEPTRGRGSISPRLKGGTRKDQRGLDIFARSLLNPAEHLASRRIKRLYDGSPGLPLAIVAPHVDDGRAALAAVPKKRGEPVDNQDKRNGRRSRDVSFPIN